MRQNRIGRSSLRRTGDDSSGGSTDHLEEALTNSGGLLLEGAVVRISGNNTFTSALATTAAGIHGTIGVLSEDVNGADSGAVITNGRAAVVRMDSITAGVVAGDLIYVSATDAGKATNIEPAFPNIPVIIGTVKDASAFLGNATVVADVNTQFLVDAGAPPPSALWTVGLTRVYAVDFVSGNDANKGFADPATSSAADYAIACAAAGAVAKKTFAGLAAILPRIGNGRSIEIVIAASTYTGGTDFGSMLRGLEGYLSVDIRGTVTDATAGSIKFAGTTADATMAGAVTGTGLFAAGYNPTGAPTTSVIQCLRVGGAAPAFGAEPAVPEGLRIRFDSATATAALRNICRQVSRVSGTDTVSLQTVLPAVPAAGDVFYLEQGGVVVDGYSINCPPNGGLGIQIVGILSTGVVTINDARVRLSLCGCNQLLSNGTQLTILATPQAYTHPVFGLLTVGGGMRVETDCLLANGQYAFVGLVVVQGITIVNSPTALAYGAGCAARSVSVAGSRLGTGNDGLSVANLGTSAAVGIPRLFGGSGSPVIISGSSMRFGGLNVDGAGANAALSIRGCNQIIFGAVVTGTTGNTDVGMDLTASRGSLIVLASTPTVTGALGDVRLTGGQIITWAQAAAGIVDTAGNRLMSSSLNIPLTIVEFSGSIVGAVGAVVSYLANTGPIAANQIVALRRPTSNRVACRLRVTNLVNTSANAVTVTLYKNGVATAMVVSIPAATAANVKFVDSAHPILFVDGDDFDLRMDDAADVAGVVTVSASLEWAV